MASANPLLQPFRLKHLTLHNRVMSTAHEPAYTEDGLPKDRYRAGGPVFRAEAALPQFGEVDYDARIHDRPQRVEVNAAALRSGALATRSPPATSTRPSTMPCGC